jgi:hypothetical protein
VLAGTGLIGIHLATGETSFGTHAACHGRRRGDDLPGARPLSGMTSNEALAVLSPERRRSRRALWRSMASSSRRARLDRTGATTLVALDADQLVGVVQLQSDAKSKHIYQPSWLTPGTGNKASVADYLRRRSDTPAACASTSFHVSPRRTRPGRPARRCPHSAPPRRSEKSKRAASRCRAGEVGVVSAVHRPDSHPPASGL